MDHLLLHLLLLLPPPVPCTSPLSLFWRLKGTAPWSDRSAIITTLYASSSFSWSDRTLFPPDLAAFARETSCLFSPFFRPPPHWSPLGSISLSISLSPVSSFPFHTSTPLCSSLPTRLISHLSSLFLPCSCKLGWVPQLDLPLLQSRIVVVIISGEKLLYDPNIGVLPWVSSVPSLHQMHCIHLRKRRCPCSRSTTTSSCNLALLLLMVVVVDWWAPWRLRFRYLSRWSDPECSVGKWLPFASLHVWRTFFFPFFFCPDGCECERENQPWILGRKICHYNLTLSKIVATRALNSGTNRKAETVRENWPACTGNRTHYAGAVISVTTAHAC